MTMRVLLASFYGDPRLANAPAQFCGSLLRALSRRQAEVTVWTAAVAPPQAPPAAGIELVRIPAAGHRRWLAEWRPSPEVHAFARRELARLRPDAVVIGAWRGISDVALAAREAGVPSVLFLHDYSILCLRSWLLDPEGRRCSGPDDDAKCTACMQRGLGWRGRVRHGLSALPLAGPTLAAGMNTVGDDHWTVRGTVGEARRHMSEVIAASRLLVAQTPRSRLLLERAGVAAEKIELVPQSLATDKRLEAPRPPREAGHGLRLAFLGRWSPEKGADLLVEAFLEARLPPGSELWLIVSNPETVRLPPLAATAGKRVRLFAGFSGAETSRLLARADLCVVPSRCEDMASRAALEAMEHGVPVVASDSVGNAYLIEDGVNGRIFASGSRAELRAVLEEAGDDPAAAARWSANLPPLPGPEAWEQRMLEVVERAVALGAVA